MSINIGHSVIKKVSGTKSVYLVGKIFPGCHFEIHLTPSASPIMAMVKSEYFQKHNILVGMLENF